jgi:Lipopolysaccharide-assembly
MRLLVPDRRELVQTKALARPRRSVAVRGGGRALIAAVVMFTGVGGCSGFVRNPTVNSKDPGFFGWHFHAPFDTSEVKTVAVFFKSNVFRRDLEKQLTEAVIKEIHLRSPYRVIASHEQADSLLTGTIYSDAKNLVVEAPTNLPRELNASIMVQTKWTHNPPTDIESRQIPTTISETINFVPEVGETTLSGYNHVIQSIAKQIVDMMEQPWYNEQDLE